ncbi:hypothetical protein JTE90_023368 [Oedothorax gibbosus]|uniref:glutathione transferase n=1 Tax=Oedothorax gibbosus TaxID=931172 RepID=A0AAV6UZT1_9ARAC|nr:hypothetical protein JTE90_023368 [Oedothorax gibbosus]
MAPLTLGYWDIRGLAEPIRYLLHHKNVEFTDKRYNFTSGEWPKDKFNLDLDFPNLPYLFDGDVKITQSTTILRYLAQKYGVDGKTQAEKLKVSMVEQQIVDLRWFMLMNAAFKENSEETRASVREKAPAMLKSFEKFLGDRKFLVGEGVTYVDFLLSDTFDFFRYYIPEICKKFQTLMAHQARIVGLPGIKEYLNSPTYTRWPVFGPIAKFGGGGPEPERD